MILKNSYELYLRKKYDISDECKIVIKRGFVIGKNEALREDKNPKDNVFEIREQVYHDIKGEIEKIYSLIENTSREIYDLLQLKESVEDAQWQLYNQQIEFLSEDLVNNLSIYMKTLTEKAYQSFIFILNENSDNKLENLEALYNRALLEEEIYGKINLWINNLKIWLLDSLDQHDAASVDMSNKYYFLKQMSECSVPFARSKDTTKGFFDDILGSVEDFFNELKNKIDRLIFNIVSLVQTEAKKIDFKFHGVEKYQIVFSDNSNACEKCQEMDGKVFRVDELRVGVTAPPFHPNCGCTIIEQKPEYGHSGPLGLVDNFSFYDRDASVAYAIKWHNKNNPNYPYYISGDCANFVAQCLVAGGFAMNDNWFCCLKENIDPFYDTIRPNNKWNHSNAWSLAKDQYEYLKNSDMVTEEIVLSRPDQISAAVNNLKNPVKVGDVMYLQFDEDYPHHATIISKVEDGMIYYAAHTDSHDYKPLSDFFKEHTNGQAYILKIK